MCYIVIVDVAIPSISVTRKGENVKKQYKALRGEILKKFDTLDDFGKALGKDKFYVSKYLNGHRQFTKEKMLEWAQVLGITDMNIFFT